MNGGGSDCVVHGSSPHKCGQKSCCSAFNAVVATFFLDISVFLSSLYVPEIYPYHWKFLEGHLSRPSTCLTDIHPISEKANLLGLYSSTISLRDPLFWSLSNHLLLLGRIHIIKYGTRPSIQIWALVPIIVPQNFNFSLASKEKK